MAPPVKLQFSQGGMARSLWLTFVPSGDQCSSDFHNMGNVLYQKWVFGKPPAVNQFPQSSLSPTGGTWGGHYASHTPFYVLFFRFWFSQSTTFCCRSGQEIPSSHLCFCFSSLQRGFIQSRHGRKGVPVLSCNTNEAREEFVFNHMPKFDDVVWKPCL